MLKSWIILPNILLITHLNEENLNLSYVNFFPYILENIFIFEILEFVYVAIGNPAFCLFLYLSGVHFRGELQQVGDASEQKIKFWPIRLHKQVVSDCKADYMLDEHFSQNRYFFEYLLAWSLQMY